MSLNNKYELTKLREFPELSQEAANWFHEKWNVPVSAYKESIDESITQKEGIPQWYVVLDPKNNIIAGAGVIENDFHDRTDLTPNLCALFVEEDYRYQGIAGFILNSVCADIKNMGINTLYLMTDHIGFYEKYGWKFLTTVTENEGTISRMYVSPD